MMPTLSWRAVTSAGALALSLSSPASGQRARDALRQAGQAQLEADWGRVIELAGRGLDPAAGPQDSIWEAGVHMLAEALIEEGMASVADVWIRWAFVVDPDLRIDTLNYLGTVPNAFIAARAVVQGREIPRQHVQLSWEWASSVVPEQPGALLLVAPADSGLTGTVPGSGTLVRGVPSPLPAGTYSIALEAPDRLPLEVPVEVLPGVTTQVTLSMPLAHGYLYVVARPWGEVYLDGSRLGYTIVAAHPISVGQHRLRVAREGFAPFDTTLTVTSNELVRVGPVRLREQEP